MAYTVSLETVLEGLLDLFPLFERRSGGYAYVQRRQNHSSRHPRPDYRELDDAVEQCHGVRHGAKQTKGAAENDPKKAFEKSIFGRSYF